MKSNNCNRRDFIRTIGLGTGAALASQHSLAANRGKRPPNFVVIFCDDLGYGDLGVFGHPTIRTPNLDRMAREGQKWTNFYAAASVCTPSRAGIMTGRLPIRSGMCSDKRRVLFPDSAGGLPQSEITIARALKTRGYATGCIGKWHLGHLPQYLPTSHGFDSYYGIPYSNDMDATTKKTRDDWRNPSNEMFNVPLMRNEDIIERPADQTTITHRYGEEAVKFILKNKENPFFLYLAHNLPHVPLFRSKRFENTSKRGLYGDVVEEIDAGVGTILKTLKENGLDDNTIVVFTSDNGPWLTFDEMGGSAGLLREGKGCTFEGGMREPTIFWCPGKIQPAVVQGMGSTLDLFATFCNQAGAEIPSDRVMDSLDLSPTLFENKKSPRDTMFYYRGVRLFAVRKGDYKAHFMSKSGYRSDPLVKHDPPALYNLSHDPSEKYNIAEKHPEVIEEIMEEVKKHEAKLVKGKDMLAERIVK